VPKRAAGSRDRLGFSKRPRPIRLVDAIKDGPPGVGNADSNAGEGHGPLEIDVKRAHFGQLSRV
jgi:hypothetical protein